MALYSYDMKVDYDFVDLSWRYIENKDARSLDPYKQEALRILAINIAKRGLYIQNHMAAVLGVSRQSVNKRILACNIAKRGLYTQNYIATMLGVSRQSVNKWINAHRKGRFKAIVKM